MLEFLNSEKARLGACALGGFDNDKLSALIDLTEDEIPLYSFSLGKIGSSIGS